MEHIAGVEFAYSQFMSSRLTKSRRDIKCIVLKTGNWSDQLFLPVQYFFYYVVQFSYQKRGTWRYTVLYGYRYNVHILLPFMIIRLYYKISLWRLRYAVWQIRYAIRGILSESGNYGPVQP